MAGPTGLQVPGIDIKTEIKLPASTPVGPPTSPVLIGVGGKIVVKGSAVYGHPTTKVAVTLGKTQADFEQKAKTEWGEVKIKGQVKPGEVSKIGIEFISMDYPITLELGANADLTQPFTVSVKWPKLIQLVDLRVGSDWVFTGTVGPQIEINISPNPLWPGWPAVARAAVEGGRVAVQTGSAAIRGVFMAGELGTASVGVTVLTAAGVAAASIGWLGFGLYQIGKAQRDGRTLAVRYTFSNGYATMLADLTSPTPSIRREEIMQLLTFDWKGTFAQLGSDYINGSEPSLPGDQIEKTGKAAIAQDVDRFVKARGPGAWDAVRRKHQATYGASPTARRQQYITILYRQADKGDSNMGITLA